MRLFFLLLWSSIAFADTKISNLPALSGTAVGTSDVVPFVSFSHNETAQLKLSELLQIPSLQSPTFTGTVTAGAFSGPITGAASGNLSYTPNQYGVVLSGAANVVNVLAPNASTVYPLLSGGTSANPAWGLLTPGGGGTGVANNASSTLTISGNFGTTLTVSGTTSVTLPTTGTLANTSSNQTFSGTQTFSGQLIGKGTATNDSASAGYIGEYVNSQVTVANVPAATGSVGNLTSVSLTAGDWDVSAIVCFGANGSTTTACSGSVGTTTSDAGTFGITRADQTGPAATWSSCVAIPMVRELLSGTTSIYLNATCTYSVGTPQAAGRISARRRR